MLEKMCNRVKFSVGNSCSSLVEFLRNYTERFTEKFMIVYYIELKLITKVLNSGIIY